MWNLSKAEWNPSKSQSGAGQAIIKDYSSDPGAKPPDQKASDQDQSVALGAFMPPPPLGEVTLLRWRAKMQKIQDWMDLKGNFLKWDRWRDKGLQLDSIQNPNRLGVSFATNPHTDIIFIVMMILKTSNAVNVSQEEEERKMGTRMQRPGWRQ